MRFQLGKALIHAAEWIFGLLYRQKIRVYVIAEGSELHREINEIFQEFGTANGKPNEVEDYAGGNT
jgi:hypothetical protein